MTRGVRTYTTINDEIWKLEGFCVGGVGTNIRIPGLGLAFDIGRCSDYAMNIPTIALTHGHMDHLGAVTHHCARRELFKKEPPTYIMNPNLVPKFERLMEVWRDLDGSRLDCEVVPLAPGDSYDLGKGRSLRPFKSVHRVQTQGYCVWETRQRLKLKYKALTGKEIAALRKSGTGVMETYEVPEVGYTGDTTAAVFEASPIVRDIRVLVLECTFWDDRVPPEKAVRTGHIHVQDIVKLARAGKIQNEVLVLAHFSARYTQDDVSAAFNKHLLPLQEAGLLPKRTFLAFNPCERAVGPF